MDALAKGIVTAMGAAGDDMGRRNRTCVEERFDDVNQAAELRNWLGALVAAAP